MKGTLKAYRMKASLTQAEAAKRLGLSQPYLSQLESGRRRVRADHARAMAKLYDLPATALPVPADPPDEKWPAERLPRQLAALFYPGFAHLRHGPAANPALLVLEALSRSDLDGRVAEALPWVLVRYPDLDWKWLLPRVKLANLQNRLGFLVSVARELAEKKADWRGAAPKLAAVERQLEEARLVGETTLGRESMSEAEKAWLRAHRPAEAKRWNVLASMTADGLPYAA
jgi:transcriptional regulator with XRE-family HTH domain